MPKELSILTLNVNKGITEYKKQLKLKEYAKDFDVILLQETRGYKCQYFGKNIWVGKENFHFIEKTQGEQQRYVDRT